MAKIFLVDDDKAIIDVYRNILEIKGHEVQDTAYDGVEAVDKYRQMDEKPDIIILDHRMPLKNGIDTMRDIHAMEPNQCIIFVTADYNAAKKALELGAQSFILKPFRMDDLFNSLEMATSRIDTGTKRMKEELLAIITRMGAAGPGGLNNICDRIEKDVMDRHFPPAENHEKPDSIGHKIIGFFNMIGCKYKFTRHSNTFTFTNSQCPWMGSTGPSPSFCFVCKCVISRFAGRTSRDFDLSTERVIMDGADTCVLKLMFG